MNTNTRVLLMLVVALITPFNILHAEPDGEHDLLFFLSGGLAYHQVTSEDGLQENDLTFEADFLYSYLKGDYRFLAEYVLSTEESELERFQFGWQLEEDTLGWIGRFHSPARYWNSAYHHGQYLQTSITRPLSEKFEDEGGILPTHVTGAMFKTMLKRQGVDGINTVFSLGATSVIDDHELAPFNLLDARSNHRGSVDFRIAYLPDQLGENQVGLILNWSNLVVDGNHIAEQQGLLRVEQGIIGVYIDWQADEWRILSNLTYVDNQMIKQSHNQTDTFLLAYLQAEYELDQEWKIFGRVEGSHGEDNSEYIKLFPSAVQQRQMLGLRYDFYRNHALTLEVSKIEIQSTIFDQAWLQWSSALP